MKKEKTELRRLERFPFYDFTGIETHLQNMAARGWLLKERGNTFWTYEKIPPQELIFTVSYLPDWSEFDPAPTDGQQLYYELCESAGWILVASWNKMQIFCTSNPDPIPLETDPQTRLETIEKTMNRTLLPGLALILFLIYTRFSSFFNQLDNHPEEVFSNSVTILVPFLFLLLLTVHLLEALPYFLWLRKSRCSVQDGGNILPSRVRFRKLSTFLLVLSVLCLILMILGNSNVEFGFWHMLILFGSLSFITWLALTAREYLKEQRVSRRKNQAITISITVVGTMITVGFVVFFTLMMAVTGNLHSDRQTRVKVPISDTEFHVWNVYHDSLPLYVEDLEPVEYEYYSYQNDRQQTFLAEYQNVWQNASPHRDVDVPEFRYEIVTARFSWIYEHCLQHRLDDIIITDLERDEWIETDAAAWNCAQAWQRYSMEEPRQNWLLADPDSGTIVEITFYWDPTDEQIRIAGEKLFS